MKCQYCKNTFKTKYSLKTHQLKTKYCLKIQGKSTQGQYGCEYCSKSFTLQSSLEDHYEICKANNKYVKDYKAKNAELQKKIILLQNKLEEAEKRARDAFRREKELMKAYEKLAAISANKSTTTNNNTTNTLNLGVFDKTQDDIKRIVDEKYDRDYLVQGQLGVAKFTHKHVLEGENKEHAPVYLITDKNRGNGKYKISDTEVVSDPNMNGLTKRVHPSIKSKAIYITSTHPNPLSDEEMMAGYREVYEMDENNTIFRKGMIKLID